MPSVMPSRTRTAFNCPAASSHTRPRRLGDRQGTEQLVDGLRAGAIGRRLALAGLAARTGRGPLAWRTSGAGPESAASAGAGVVRIHPALPHARLELGALFGSHAGHPLLEAALAFGGVRALAAAKTALASARASLTLAAALGAPAPPRAAPWRWPACIPGRPWALWPGWRGAAWLRAPRPSAGGAAAPAGAACAGDAAAGRRRLQAGPPIRPPPAPRCISGGTAWFSAANVSAFGLKRSAAFGTRSDVVAPGDLDRDRRGHPRLELQLRVRDVDDGRVRHDVLRDDGLQAHLRHRADELLERVRVDAELDDLARRECGPRPIRRRSRSPASSSGPRR